jgi:hypothetical protein
MKRFLLSLIILLSFISIGNTQVISGGGSGAGTADNITTTDRDATVSTAYTVYCRTGATYGLCTISAIFALDTVLTPLRTLGAANTLVGVNAAGTALEFKSTINILMDDSAAQFKSATASKGTLKNLLSGSTDGKLLTVAYNHTDNKTLNFPDPTTGDSVAYGSAPIRLNTGGTTARVKGISDTADTIVELAVTQTLTNKTLTAPTITTGEVDGSVTSTDLTAAQVSNKVIHNIGHTDNTDIFLILPTAAAGYSFLVNIGEADANHHCVEAGANDDLYLIAAAGTVAAGGNGTAACMTAAQVGQSYACWTFKHTDDYDWMCKAISIGTSTFAAHASSE